MSHTGFHKSTKLPPIPKTTIHRTKNISTHTGIVLPINRKVYAFGVEWDDASFASLEQNKDHIDSIIMEELTLSESGFTLLAPEKFKRTQKYLSDNDPDLPIHILINNYNQTNNIWDANLLYGVLSDENKRKNLEIELTSFAIQNNVAGINIDFEEINDTIFPYYLTFLEELA